MRPRPPRGALRSPTARSVCVGAAGVFRGRGRAALLFGRWGSWARREPSTCPAVALSHCLSRTKGSATIRAAYDAFLAAFRRPAPRRPGSSDRSRGCSSCLGSGRNGRRTRARTRGDVRYVLGDLQDDLRNRRVDDRSTRNSGRHGDGPDHVGGEGRHHRPGPLRREARQLALHGAERRVQLHGQTARRTAGDQLRKRAAEGETGLRSNRPGYGRPQLESRHRRVHGDGGLSVQRTRDDDGARSTRQVRRVRVLARAGDQRSGGSQAGTDPSADGDRQARRTICVQSALVHLERTAAGANGLRQRRLAARHLGRGEGSLGSADGSARTDDTAELDCEGVREGTRTTRLQADDPGSRGIVPSGSARTGRSGRRRGRARHRYLRSAWRSAP